MRLLRKNSLVSSVALLSVTKQDGTYSWGSQSIWEVLLMNVIRQITGTVSECVCSGRCMLLTEITWYYFIHAQVEPMQLAKSEAETHNQDHPQSWSKMKSSSAPSRIPKSPGLVPCVSNPLLSRGPYSNTAPLPVPTATSSCLVG